MFIVLGVATWGARFAIAVQNVVERQAFRETMAQIGANARHRAQDRINQGDTSLDFESVEQAKQAVREATASRPAAQRITGEVTVVYLDRVTSAAKEYEAATNAMLVRSVLRPAWISEPGQIEEAREMVKAFAEANEKLRRLTDLQVGDVQGDFESRGISDPAVAREWVAAMRGDGEHAAKLSIRRCDEELAVLMLKACDLLESHWNEWEFDTENDQLNFATDQLVAEWNAILIEADAVALEQAELQRAAVGLGPETPAKPDDSEGPSGAGGSDADG